MGGLPKPFGHWHTIYAHVPVGQNGVLDRVFEQLQLQQIVRIKIEAFSIDSTSVKFISMEQALLKHGPQAIGKSRGGWNTNIQIVAADARTAIVFALSPGHDHDAPHGRALLEELGAMPKGLPILMDHAYEGNETRQLVLDLGIISVVPPTSNRLHPWDYDHAIYKKLNEIERRLFRRLKGFRRIFSRFDKLDVMFMAFVHFALIVEAMR